MIPCFNRAGMERMIAWYLAERIIAQFDAGLAAGGAADHAPAYVVPRTTAEAVERVAARVRARS